MYFKVEKIEGREVDDEQRNGGEGKRNGEME